MIPVYIDPRIGSGDLLGPLKQLGIPAEHKHLDYGDVQVVGRGEGDRPVLIGVEIKAIGDLLSCIVDKRFVGGQLGGLLTTYEIAYLLIEGVITVSPARELLLLKKDGESWKWKKAPFGERPWTFEGITSWQHSVARSGVRIVQTCDRRATAAWIASLHTNWSKPWEDHRTLIGRLLKPLEAGENALQTYDAPPQMQVAACLARGIGWEKALAAVKVFKSIKRMIHAPASAWAAVPGIGRTLAARVVAEIEKEVEL